MFTETNGIASIRDGKLQGKRCERKPEVWAFLGIPYAAPPTGENRWRAPQPVEPWPGVRDATRYAPDARRSPCPRAPFIRSSSIPMRR